MIFFLHSFLSFVLTLRVFFSRAVFCTFSDFCFERSIFRIQICIDFSTFIRSSPVSFVLCGNMSASYTYVIRIYLQRLWATYLTHNSSLESVFSLWTRVIKLLKFKQRKTIEKNYGISTNPEIEKNSCTEFYNSCLDEKSQKCQLDTCGIHKLRLVSLLDTSKQKLKQIRQNLPTKRNNHIEIKNEASKHLCKSGYISGHL